MQYKKIGAAVALFLAFNAILYKHSFNDDRVMPQKGNLLQSWIFHEAVKKSAGSRVVQAAKSGSVLAQQVVTTHQKEFGIGN